MTERALVSRNTMELATALATTAIGAAVMFGSLEHDIGWSDAGPAAGYFPFRIGAIIVAVSLFNLYKALRLRAIDRAAFMTTGQARLVLSFALPMIAFVIAAVLLGLYVATALYLALTMIFQGGYRPLFAIAVGLAVAVAMRLIFPVWFQVPLLTGPLEKLLGIY
jgi:hypothetical protein